MKVQDCGLNADIHGRYDGRVVLFKELERLKGDHPQLYIPAAFVGCNLDWATFPAKRKCLW